MCGARKRSTYTYSLWWLLLLNIVTVYGNGADDLQRQQSHDEILTNLQQNVPLQRKSEHVLRKQQQMLLKLASNLQLQPPEVDFDATFLGSTRSFQITLINTHAEQSVQVLSTATTAEHPTFYCNLQGANGKVIPPRRNITLDIGFLPWKEGLSKAKLIFQTNVGQATLPVSGVGLPNPYRLKPMLELKAPLNATLAPEIHMYNPHDRPLQIMEVYSSGGKFQLELPSGGSEGPQTLWKIPPYTTKPIIRIRFHGINAGNYTAYIRVKLAELGLDSLMASNEHIFVIPITFEILPNYGLYADNPVADFGRITADKKSDKIYFHLPLHSSHRQRGFKLLQSVEDEVLQYDFNAQRLVLNPAAFNRTTSIEKLLLFVSATTGKLDQQAKFSVIVRGEIFKGQLAYDSNQTIFVQPPRNEKTNEPRLLCVQNKFDVPMTLKNISLHQNNNSMLELTILKDLEKLVLLPDMRVNLLQLKAKTISHNYQSIVRIYTNITLFEIPVIVCSGRLHVTTQNTKRFHLDEPYNTELNLGAIPLAELSHEAFILLRNPNSINVKLNNWDFQSTEGIYFHTTFLGCFNATHSSNATTMVTSLEQVKFNFCAAVGVGELGVFKVAIQPHITEQQYATLKIWTPYEIITITIKFFTWVGSLEIDQERIQFTNCFPGKICTSELSIHSSFEQPIHLISINFAEPGFNFLRNKQKELVIAPRATTHIGSIRFEPGNLCGNTCYIAWNLTKDPFDDVHFDGTDAILNFDLGELRSRVERYRQLKWLHKSTTITLYSREIQKFELQFALDIEWPKLVKSKPSMPVLEVGKATAIFVDIANPSDTPLLVDYFLSNPELAKQTKFSLPPEVVETSSSCYLTDEFVFDLPNGAPAVPILVPVGKRLKVPLTFGSPVSGSYCTLLHIRNNLTMYEAVWISGKSVQSQFRFGNRKPGSHNGLLFEVTHPQLNQCAPETQVLVKRSFMARNLGDIPIKISSFYIEQSACTGYGFSVLDCSEFVLAANASKKIELVFKPDFTQLRIVRTLTLHTNLSYPVQYKLVGRLPREQVQHCASVTLSRPHWEQRLRVIAIIVLLVTLLLVVLAAHIDYSNLLVAQSTLFFKRDKGVMQPTFNLRNIAVKSQLDAEEQQASEKRRQNAQKATAKYNNSSSNNFLRKRDTKRYFANGNGITFSERQFKLKQEADRAAAAAKTDTANRDNELKQTSRCTKASKTCERDEAQGGSPKERDREREKERETNAKLNVKKQQQQQQPKLNKKVKANQTNQKDEKPKTPDDQSQERRTEKHECDIVPMKEGKQPEQILADNCDSPQPDNTESPNEQIPHAEQNQDLMEPYLADDDIQETNVAHPFAQRLNPFASEVNVQYADDTHNTIHCITSPWDTSSHVTFSEIFPSKANAMNANEQVHAVNFGRHTAENTQSDINQRNVDLGPIGSRRSPTLASVAAAPMQSSLFSEFLNAAQYQEQRKQQEQVHSMDWSSNASQKLSYMPTTTQPHEERHKLLESLDRSPLNSAKHMQRAPGQRVANWQMTEQQQQQQHERAELHHQHAQAMPVIQHPYTLLESVDNYPSAYNWLYQNSNESNWSPFTNASSANYTTGGGSSWLAGNTLRPPPGLGYAASTSTTTPTATQNNATQQAQAGVNLRAHDHLMNSMDNYNFALDSLNTTANARNDNVHATLWQNNFNNKN